MMMDQKKVRGAVDMARKDELCGHGGGGDAQCGYTLARMVTMAGQGGRGDDGGAMSVMNQMKVQQ